MSPPSVAAIYSLLKNGNFVEWRESDPLPLHWTLGATLRADKIPSSIRAVQVPATSFSHPLEQTWQDTDTAQRITDVFGQTVAGLNPGTEYELRVVAHNQSKNTVIVSAFEVNEYNPDNPASGKPGERLELAVVTIPPGESAAEYKGTFSTASDRAVRLAARIQERDPEFPGTMLWYAWELHPVAGEQSNLVPNGSFANWPPEQAVPSLWRIEPPRNLNFEIERLAGTEFVCGKAMKLTWNKPQPVHRSKCIAATLENLDADTSYTVELIVNNPSQNTYRLSAWESTGGDDLVSLKLGDRLSHAVLQIGPESPGTYRAQGSFTTRRKGAIRLILSCEESEENKTFPAELVMEEWRVYEQPVKAEAKPTSGQ